MKITRVSTGAEKYNGTLSDLYSAGKVSLDVLAPDVPTLYNFTVTMNPDAGNAYMGLTEKFDMDIGFDATPTSQRATTGGTSAPAGLLRSVATSLGFTPAPTAVVTTETPTVAGAQTEETPAVKGAEDADAKGSADITCPWWWIVALVLAVAYAFIGGVIRALEPEKFLRKYYYVWPPVLAVIAWGSHHYLHGTFQATWFCNNYWLVMLVMALLGEIAFAWIVRPRNSRV